MQKDQSVKAEDEESTLVQHCESISTEQDHFHHNHKKNCYHKIQRSKVKYEI